jgi:crotonobetainyl-CoA:carnitine CoA-transferase CaiB-like acyl-CoA transferase
MADPTMIESSMNIELDHKEMSKRIIPVLPITFSETTPHYYGAPKIGEHTDAVLGELGYNVEEIASMRREGGVF